MTNENLNRTGLRPKLETKDYLLLVPTLATGLAIIYELGSFYPLGTVAFSLFSITDHLLWALQMLPYSLIVVGGSIIAIVVYEAIHSTAKGSSLEKTSSPETKSRARRYLSKLLNFCIGVAFLAYGVHDRSGTLIVIGIFGLAIFCTPKSPKLKPAVMMAAALFVVCVVFALGFDGTRRALNGTTPARFEFSGGDVRNLVLVRSGDHALLLFDRDLQQFMFVKLDELKRIVWQRAPSSRIKIVP